MEYDFTRLDDLCESADDEQFAVNLMEKYQIMIDDDMGDCKDDMIEYLYTIQDTITADNMEKIADDASAKFMKITASRVYDRELPKLMDAYNDGEMEKKEYLISCEVLVSIKSEIVNLVSDLLPN